MGRKFVQQFLMVIIGIVGITAAVQSQVFQKLDETAGTLPQSYPVPASERLWKKELEVQKFLQAHPEAYKQNSLRKATAYSVGSKKSWYADDLSPENGPRYLVPSTCRAVGTNCYVFVEDASWTSRVTQSAVDSVRIYFDSKTPVNSSKGIYQTDVDAFGNPPNVDNDPKIIILMLDIQDGYSGSGGYVEGYFISFNEINPSQSGYSTSNYAEIFYLDTNPLNLTTEGGLYSGLSTLAHEFQHMITWNYDRNKMTFINEGCSTLAEVNCGFPIYTPSLYAKEPNHYLFDWRRDNGTAVLTDYSRTARYFTYMRDQFGIGFFKPLVASTQFGESDINAGLQAIGSSLRFSDVLKNWFIANILDDRTVDTKYGYLYPNLPKSAGRICNNPNMPLTTDTVQIYGVQYISFKHGSQLKATFTVSNPFVLVKAVEIGPTAKRVLDVTPGVQFSEPLFGSTYKEITFAVMNTSSSAAYTFTYQSTGISAAIELRYDYSEPTGVYNIAANDTVCVLFDAVQDGRLDSVRVALRRSNPVRGGVWKSTGAVRPTPLGTPLALNLSVSGSTPYPGVPYPIPWPNWATIDLRSKNISTNSPFAVGFIMDGAYSNTQNNYIMATDGPIGSGATSLTYSSISTSGPNWYYYTVNDAGDSVACYIVRAYVSFPATGVRTTIELSPSTFRLGQNYPNPFNPTTNIQFALPLRSFVTLKVYDLVGREVATLVNGITEAGPHEVTFDASGLPTGVYLYRMVADKFVETKKLVLIK
ncbi:MAG: T9SS C-terminal target domain-containing protein [Ignavibacteriae bacterium]|nr:MAG: T9SS C-terminal target domain-containing protein [Ignavibacteriota bacterium]